MYTHRQFKVLEEKNDRKKRSIRNFFLLLLLLSPVKNRRTVENVSQPIFPANYWRGARMGGEGERETETKRGRNNGKRTSVPRFPADKRNDRCRAVIGKQ